MERVKKKIEVTACRTETGAEWVVWEGVGAGGRNDPSLICTYE
jgi:hypothetical protein